MPKSPQYHIRMEKDAIYAGCLCPRSTSWRTKNEVTDEAIESVRDYLLNLHDKGGKSSATWNINGRTVTLSVSAE